MVPDHPTRSDDDQTASMSEDAATRHDRILRLQRRLVLAGFLIPALACVGLASVGSFHTPSLQLASAVCIGLFLLGSSLIAVAATLVESRAQFWYQTAARLTASQFAHPERVDDLSGWKVAEVTGATPTFTGFLGARYSTQAVMRCLLDPDHSQVELSCSCGFHAFLSRERAVALWRRCPSGVLLQVEGYGRTVVHSAGWRAQRQEVARVLLPARCTWCRQRTDGLVRWFRYGEWVSSCSECAQRAGRELWDLPRLRNLWSTEVSIGDRALPTSFGGPRFGLMVARLLDRRTVRSGQQ